ncbi:MAG: DNA mismatch repair protein [Bacteroidota bacterium]
MSFITDKQTLEDLNIFGRPGTDCIYELYNKTRTHGGAKILEKMFLYPLYDINDINKLSNTFQYFSKLDGSYPFKAELLDCVENYLSMTDARTKLSHGDNNLVRKFSNLLSADGDYTTILNGISATSSLLKELSQYIEGIKPSAILTAYQKELEEITILLKDEELGVLISEKSVGKISYAALVNYDELLRFKSRDKIRQLLAHIYYLDVYISVAEVAAVNSYIFPEALTASEKTIKLTNVYHPLIKKPISNTINITPQENVIFLTGANMAGKSTFMKSLGIALYLAHMGFPIAASSMEFSIRDGIYTTINLPDDLSSGNSHFYAEVLRVKKIAKELGSNKNLFIIFDELFRGTNVKDAHEGTVAITQAFARKENCMFVVSTHIVEAGEVLRKLCDNIKFVYLPTKMTGNIPTYTYRLEPGITADRHGMLIINNEGILEIIKSRKSKAVTS